MYPSMFNSFSVIRTASAKKSPFSRTAAHIFVSPGDAPGAITINVVWMEREFDAYKLSCCMCPSIYNRLWDRARYLWINRHFIIPPLHSTLPLGGSRRNVGTPFSVEKTRMVSLPDGGKISKICLFVLTWSTNVTDRRTDGQTLHDSIDRACMASRGKNVVCKRKKFVFNRFLNFKPVKRS